VRSLEKSVEFARNIYDELGSQITSWRRAIVSEVRLLRDEFQEETQRWLESLKPDVRQAIVCQKGEYFFSLPVYKYLLELFAFPGTVQLAEEWSNGFSLLGEIPEGVG